MKKAMITIGIILFCVIPFYNNGNTQPAQRQVLGLMEGDKSYTPTKLEWLALQLNVLTGYQTEHIDIKYTEVKTKDTIVIYIGYSPKTSVENLTLAEKASKDAVRKMAKLYGWDNWVKIDVHKELVR